MTKEALVDMQNLSHRFLELAWLTRFPDNPRVLMDERGLEELALSIRSNGVLVPLLVREARSEEGAPEWQIVCGQRRAAAARLAGLKKVPCLVAAMTDDAAREIAVVDNLQRAQVSAVEEAEAFGELLLRLGSAEQVALRVGKDQAYVAQRLRLMTLTDAAKLALHERLIGMDHALLLARLGSDEQDAELKWCIDSTAGVKTSVTEVIEGRLERQRTRDEAEGKEDGEEDESDAQQAQRPSVWRRKWEPQSVQRLKEHIASSAGVLLDRAAWPMVEDYLLPDVPSCLDCPQNTQANTPLFGDLEMGAAVCTDGACFRAKTSAWVELAVADATRAAAPVEPLRVSWRWTTRAPKMPKEKSCDCTRYAISGKECPVGSGCRLPVLTQTFAEGQWREATTKCEHARVAVTVDYGDTRYDGPMRKPGEVVQVCIDSACKVHPKAYAPEVADGSAKSSGKRSTQGRQQSETEQQRNERYERERKLCETEDAIRHRIFWSVLRSISASSELGHALRYLTNSIQGSSEYRKTVATQVPGVSEVFLDFFVVLLDLLASDLRCVSYEIRDGASGVEESRAKLWGFAKWFEVDPDAITAEFFHERGSLASGEDVLYPKGVPWPKPALAGVTETEKKPKAQQAGKAAAKTATKAKTAKAAQAKKPETKPAKKSAANVAAKPAIKPVTKPSPSRGAGKKSAAPASGRRKGGAK